MSPRAFVLMLAGLVAGPLGCSAIATSVSGQTTVNGEAWYVKTTHILFIPVANTVYYCPPPAGRGTPDCREALMYDDRVEMEPVQGQPASAATRPEPASAQTGPAQPPTAQPAAPPPAAPSTPTEPASTF